MTGSPAARSGPPPLPRPADAPAAASQGGQVVGAIPARWGSTRLPGKPLAPIAGKPMIEHVWRRAKLAPSLDRLVVLTDDERIVRVVEGFGGEAEMTPSDCASGTDRIAHAARGWSDAVAIVNVQGDEPLIDPASVEAIARHLRAHPADPIVTIAVTTGDSRPGDPDLTAPDVVKVVTDRRGYALYFSRAAIPFPRNPGEAPVRRHVGLYGYQREALFQMAALAPTPLEKSESLEQLRALENGLAIRVLETTVGEAGLAIAVDTPEDLARVEARIREAHPDRP